MGNVKTLPPLAKWRQMESSLGLPSYEFVTPGGRTYLIVPEKIGRSRKKPAYYAQCSPGVVKGPLSFSWIADDGREHPYPIWYTSNKTANSALKAARANFKRVGY